MIFRALFNIHMPNLLSVLFVLEDLNNSLTGMCFYFIIEPYFKKEWRNDYFV